MFPPVQLSLGVVLRDDTTFDNFYAQEPGVVLAINALQELARGQDVLHHLIWGAPGCGLTHLLQAVCHEAQQADRAVQYLPLRDIRGYAPEDICDGLEHAELVCFDGIELIAGNRLWEEAIFHLYNRSRDLGHSLLFSTHAGPTEMAIQLPDLRSRLLGAMVYHITSLNDEDKQRAMVMRAKARGLNMPDEVAKYIIHRSSRDMNHLFNVLNRLDDVSLQQQRKLTIPFVKQTLSI